MHKFSASFKQIVTYFWQKIRSLILKAAQELKTYSESLLQEKKKKINISLWFFVKNHPIPFRKAASSHFIQLLFPLLRTSFQKGALADKPEQFPSELETNAFIIWEKTRLIAWFPVLGTPWSAFPYVCVLCMFGQLLLLRVQYVLEFLHQNHENWLNPFYRVWVSSSFKFSSSNMYQAWLLLKYFVFGLE